MALTEQASVLDQNTLMRDYPAVTAPVSPSKPKPYWMRLRDGIPTVRDIAAVLTIAAMVVGGINLGRSIAAADLVGAFAGFGLALVGLHCWTRLLRSR